MKKLLLLFSAALTMLFVGCTQFDDTRIWDAIDELEDLFKDLDDRVEDLEEACEKMNTNIEALQTLVAALQANDTITAIAPIKQGDKIIGYTISFSKSEPITIYHGNDGKDGADGEDGKDGENGADGEDGYTPQIGIAKDSDNVYYWTLDGEWLLDENGNKIKAVGTDGKDGEDGEDGANGNDGSNGENGENGADGKDGITPQLEIRDGYWYISYDNGATWKELGKATGEDGKDGADGEDGKDGEDGTNGADGQDGKDGDSLFQSVTWDEEYAYFTLSDGTVITIPLSREAVNEPIEIIAKYYWAEYDGSWDDIHAYEIKLTDTYNILEEKYDNEESNSNFYHIGICTNEEPVTGVLPNGTYVLSTTYEAGTLSGVGGGECYIIRNGEWEEVYATDAVLVISDNKIDGTFTLENGEVHHVVYEGSLKLYEEGDEEDTTTPPANEIWYTSTDGEVVTPYDSTAFGVNIVSNTYGDGMGIITFDGDVTSIGRSAFTGCDSLTSITIPDSVTSIGDYAFYYCSSLASVTIGNSVTSIGEVAFAACSSLASVTIPDSVTEIGLGAFCGCLSLASVTIPDSVTEIGDYAFNGCTSLTSFYGKYASEDGRCLIVDGTLNSFAPAGLTEYTIPDSVTSIGELAFSECSSLTSITIPDSVTSIGKNAFVYCSSLASVTIPDGVTSIGERAFQDCSSLTSIIIPDSVTSIGEAAFCGCSSLASVTIPDSVTSIGDWAFYYCSSLASVYCKATTPPSLGVEVFYNNASECKIYVPTESVDAYKAAEGWSTYADDIVGYDFGGNSGDTNGVKEVAADYLWGMYAWDEAEAVFAIMGVVSDKLFEYNPSNDSWSYCFVVVSDTEPINDEVPLGTYTYVDFEKLVNGEVELKTGIFTHLVDAEYHCIYTDANGEIQEYKYTEGTMVVSEGKIELTVTLENGEVHHVVYEGSLQTWGEAA